VSVDPVGGPAARVPESPSAPAAARVPLLAMRGIRKRFAAGEVLHGVDFTLNHGEIHALVGQNGAGKSTLMKVLGGVYPDHAGDVAIEGRRVRLDSPRRALDAGVAVIYQEFALVPDLSVAENIALGREPEVPGRGVIARRLLDRRSAEEAAEFGIALPMAVHVRELGVAEQQLTEVVRALARRARILVMDEPTARLSPGERDRLFATIRGLREAGVGIVYISHFLEEVFEVADTVTVLRDGHVVASRPAAELDLASLATLMVGGTLAGSTRAHAADRLVAGDPVLELDRVSVVGRPPVSFEVRAGEILGVAGLVGSGRTRLARTLVGIGRPAGTIRVGGRAVRFESPAAAARAGVVLLPEDRKRDGLVLSASIGTNVTLTALGRSLSRFGFVRRAARARLMRALIERFRIMPADPERAVRTLSGGNQQKSLLARAFAADARVLILDQPTAGVDVGAKAELYERILEMARRGVAIVLISDDLDELLLLTDSIVVMHAGRSVGVRPTDALSREGLLAAITTGAIERAA
jgi:ABC-type sugar transport system ATPase subunit